MIAAWLQKPDRTGKSGYSLEYLGESELGLKGIEFDEIVKKGQTFADIDLETATPYAAEDADFTFQLWKKYEAAIKDSDLYNNIEMKILPILGDMELAGIHLDTDFLRQYSLELAQGIKDTEQNIYKEVGHEFNIASPMQLQTVLFEERGLTPGKKTKRGYSTDTSVLEELSYVFDRIHGQGLTSAGLLAHKLSTAPDIALYLFTVPDPVKRIYTFIT